MRLVSYLASEKPAVGALLDNNHLVDLAKAGSLLIAGGHAAFSSMQDFIEGGDTTLNLAKEIVANAPEQAVIKLDDVTLLAPLPVPAQMRDFANYELHVKQALASSMSMRAAKEEDSESALERFKQSGAYDVPPIWYERPLYYKCNRFSVIGHDTDVIWPHYANVLDYELEYAAVIGRKALDVSEEEARDYIFGYTIYNDFSARDTQVQESQFRMGPAKGKDFDTGNVIGPCIVTKDELTDPYNLTMTVRVNGEERGRGRSGDMQHNFERCISFLSQSETLYPGEIIAAGTVGNGSGFEFQRFLEPDDVVELEVEGIGILRNRVRKV